MTQGQELAEAMLKQYERKEEEVQQALGEAQGDYLSGSQKLTSGNTAVLTFKKVTKLEVEKKITEVDKKKSFGNDGILYGLLKKI